MSRGLVPKEVADAAARLGSIIEQRRASLGLSREGLSVRARVSAETVRKLERHRATTPEFFTIARICSVLELGLDDAYSHAIGEPRPSGAAASPSTDTL